MTINVTLSKNVITRLSFLLFFQNKGLYIYLAAVGVLTVYALNSGNYGLLIVGWLPYLFYVGLGVFNILRQSGDPENPQLLPTRYTFSGNGVTVSTKLGENKFEWAAFKGWQVVANTFVLFHKDGFIFAIPKKDVSATQIVRFEQYLKEHIQR